MFEIASYYIILILNRSLTKKLLIMKFFAGILTGVVLTLIVLYFISNNSESNTPSLEGLTIFSKKQDCLTIKKLKILQTIKPNMALAEFGESNNGMIVLLINYENQSYYDDQLIKISDSQCAKQIGTYQYMTGLGLPKTVQAIIIE